ncbi:MAG: hypothetical protein JNN15_03695 [Blastocatellia bacterium]|nr:hypothetical protein [Blastocatellia bacterium]
MAQRHLVISAIGADNVGLVEKISKFVSENGANIEDSKMAVFCGDFAIIMLVSGSAESLTAIESKQSQLAEETKLAVFTKRASERKKSDSTRFRLVASSLDHPGIVYKITSSLSEFGINIESMETKSYYAPTSGAPMFRFEAEITIPKSTDLSKLQTYFAVIGEQESIDITVIAD